MVFRRSALDAIGGIESADGQLVDDMYLGARVVEAGYGNVMGTSLLPLIGHGLGFVDFTRMWRRWLFFGRAGMSSSFVLPILVRAVGYFLALGLTIAALAIGPPSLALAPGFVWICEGMHQLRLNRLTGGARVPVTRAWMAWGPYLMALPILVSMLVYPRLRWRGRVYRVGFDARLEKP
jgi:hypothetical protein